MVNAELTKEQATYLAEFIHSIRRDWNVPGIFAALGTARLRVGATPASVGLAAIRCATNPKNRTPVIIALEGDHWQEPERPEPTPTPPRKCPTCRSYHVEADRCLGPPPTDHSDNPQHIGDDLAVILNIDRSDTIARHGIALCRQALAEAKRNLCPHGVDWHHCHQHNGHVIASETKETE
jgi:hypothetical protein